MQHLEHSKQGMETNKKDTVENEENVKMDILAVPDTGARVNCPGVMHEVEVTAVKEARLNVLPDSTGGGGPDLKQQAPAVGQDDTQLPLPVGEGCHGLSQHVDSADNVVETYDASPYLETTVKSLSRRLRYRA